MKNRIILYPSNWLYNAGVIGLSLYKPEFINFIDNTIEISRGIFNQINLATDYFDVNKIINLKGKNEIYPNYIDTKGNQIPVFISFIKSFKRLRPEGFCNICSTPYSLSPNRISILSEIYKDNAKNFLSKIKKFDMVFNKLLGPTSSKFPNGFWNFNRSLDICHLCSFVIIHHHLAFTKLVDGSQIFVNAPSFKLMYELNRFFKAIYETQNNNENTSVREILAMSIIDYTLKMPVILGYWTSMNIEVVIKKKDNIDFFSLPDEVVKIISNKQIAYILSDIGETDILNIVLNQEYSELINYAYKILRVSLKKAEDVQDFEKKYLNHIIKLDKNKKAKTDFAHKLLKLYSLIEEKTKGAEV